MYGVSLPTRVQAAGSGASVMPLSPCIQYFCIQSDLSIQCCHVSNRSVSNWFGVQSVRCPILPCPIGPVSNPTVSKRFVSYCVESVRCPILACPIGSVSNLAVSSRSHGTGFYIMCPIRMCPMGSITRSNYSCVQYSCVQLVLCPMLLCAIGPVYPMLLSCFQSKYVQSVLCPIVVCRIGSVSNPTVFNWTCVQYFCVQ